MIVSDLCLCYLRLSFEKPRHTWKDDTTMTLKEIGCEDVDWINLSQDKNKWWDIVKTELKVWLQ